MQYSLQQPSDRRFDIGDTIMVFETEGNKVYHSIEQIVSLNPVQLKTLRPAESK